MSDEDKLKNFDVRQIMKMLPHRYPFLLVDRVLDAELGKSIRCLKNVTMNEAHFVGHFPDLPTMPGVLMLEALAQACGILAVMMSESTAKPGVILYFAGIDNCRFKRPVVPGDQLTLEGTLEKHKRDVWKFHARALVGDELACEADLMSVVKHPE